MTPVKQTILGRGPDHGEPCGNCMQAAIATILDLPLEEVPHFLQSYEDIWWANMQAWLATRGWQIVALPLDYLAPGIVPIGYHLMHGRTCRDSDHVVVAKDGVMVFDPHPSDAGLTEIKTYEVLVPVRELSRAIHNP